VIDASVVLAWQFKDEANEYADSIVARLRDEEAAAPAIWPLEIANAFLVGIRRARITPQEAAAAIAMVLDLPVAVRSHAALVVQNVLEFAQTLDLSAYDASYIYLAKREQLPIATLDGRLRAAATRAGIALLE
jgi:predicted nucleic acid-binding protein